ncbi:AAA family ATPase [Muricoccus radiodurans]|uniref:AAA family ATPase n=1 Tax=Muricoccus radiodurans TaxID=2231721 RepID=UPI003CF0391E
MSGASAAAREEGDAASARPDRKALICFVADADTEAAVRNGLSAVPLPSADFLKGDVRRAIATLQESPTPLALIVDVSGHPQPLAALEDLAGVVEPDARVFVIGDRQDLSFYRQVTQGLGVADYLYKPVTPAMVAETFGHHLARRRDALGRARGGRLISITGARGGVGASTIAVNLTWHLANVAHRHTVVLDADLHRGCVPLLLNIAAGTGLRTALEHPERVDELFVERSAIVQSDRLHALASEEALGKDPVQQPGACAHLLSMLRRRYALIVADTPLLPGPMTREILDAAQQRVIVMEPTLAGIRDALRLLQMPPGPAQAHRPIIVLNRHNRRGALPIARVSETMRIEPDILLPDLPAGVEDAATMGEPAAKGNRAFAAGIAALAQAAAGIVTATAPRRGLFGLFRR